MQTVLTIAGSDPTAGAGVQADLKTFAALGVYGTTAITALTVQDSMGVRIVSAVDPALVTAQIDAIVGDIGANATKIGMLATRALVIATADAIERHRLALVVLDPVISSSSGHALLDDDGVAALVARLLPLAFVVTPNTGEAERLTGIAVRSVADARRAAARLVELGAQGAVVKGGHLDGPPIDVCFDGRTFSELDGRRIDTRHTHGTGCTFSAAIAARLARGDDLHAAARAAKTYVARALEHAPGLGRGRGPLQHFPDVY